MNLKIEKEKIKGYAIQLKNNLINSKKYWMIFLIFIIFSTLSNLNIDNYLSPNFEIIVISFISLCGILIISYFFNKHDEKNIHKTAFIIILIFGIVCCLLIPFGTPDDEYEHFPRAEITSTGNFFPEYTNNSFKSIESVYDLSHITINRDSGFNIVSVENATIFTSNIDDQPINYSTHNFHSAFAQNPFYGYLAQALGIAIAKFFDLNAIWMLWLGRIFNIILYASLVSLSIKKSPILKVPMIVISCIPLAIFQASSMSIDAFINGLSLFVIAYFFNLYKSKQFAIDKKEIITYTILVLILGTLKVTFFAFIFLLLFIPKKNFKEEKTYYFNFIPIFIIALFAMLWTNLYANIGFQESYRHMFWIKRNINSTGQIQYLLNHKKDTLLTIFQLPQYIDKDLTFNSLNLSFNSFNQLYLLFLGGVCLMYPHEKYDLKPRIGSIIVSLIIYCGTYFVLLLTWTPIGQLNPIHGVLPRYFLPLFILIPFAIGFNNMKGNKTKIDCTLIVITIGFISSMIISMLGFYY